MAKTVRGNLISPPKKEETVKLKVSSAGAGCRSEVGACGKLLFWEP